MPQDVTRLGLIAFFEQLVDRAMADRVHGAQFDHRVGQQAQGPAGGARWRVTAGHHRHLGVDVALNVGGAPGQPWSSSAACNPPEGKRRRTLITVLFLHTTASATPWSVRGWPWLRSLSSRIRALVWVRAPERCRCESTAQALSVGHSSVRYVYVSPCRIV